MSRMIDVSGRSLGNSGKTIDEGGAVEAFAGAAAIEQAYDEYVVIFAPEHGGMEAVVAVAAVEMHTPAMRVPPVV